MKNICFAGLGALAVLLGGACSYSESAMNFDLLTYTVAEMMGPPQNLTIRTDGEARYESHSNAGYPDLPEIGFYETALGPAEMEGLRAALGDPPFASLPDHAGRIASGDRLREVTLTAGGNRLQKAVGTTGRVDPKLANLLERLDRIAAEVRKHPVHTLRMNVSRVEMDADGTITLDFGFSAGGKSATEFVNPAAPASAAGVFVRGWPDKSAAEFRAGEVFGAQADRVSESAKLENGRATKTSIPLAPGESVSFRASAHVAPKTGVYVLEIRYQNTVALEGAPDVLIGEILSPPLKLELPSAKLP